MTDKTELHECPNCAHWLTIPAPEIDKDALKLMARMAEMLLKYRTYQFDIKDNWDQSDDVHKKELLKKLHSCGPEAGEILVSYAALIFFYSLKP